MKEILINGKLDAIYNSIDSLKTQNYGILGGISGILLFAFEYEKCFFSKTNFSKTAMLLEKTIELVTENATAIQYSYGLSGVNIVLKKILSENIIDEDSANSLKKFTEEIDTNCLATLHQEDSPFYTDFLHGELGILWGIKSFSNNNLNIQGYLHGFIKSTNIDTNGYFYCYDKEQSEEMISLGLSHGTPAALTIISSTMEDKIYCMEVCSIIKKFINSNRSSESLSCFPSSITGNKVMHYSRLAWCYGDLGIGIAFWQAGKALDREDWKQEAINIFLHSSKRRDLEQNGVKDAGLCHGTAGIAHIFNRMYWETKNPIFKETANYWIEETLKMAYHEDGLAGYKSWRGKEEGWVNEHGFLEGIAGIGLALLAHISDEEPTWDRCLLLS